MAETLTPEIRDLLALRLVPGLGPRLTAALLARFGSAGAALEATEAQLLEVPHIGSKLAQQLRQALRRTDVEAELTLLAQHGVGLLIRGKPEYPALLETIADPPPLLYVRGQLTAADANAIALVGSRSCTAYGRRVTERLATDLARAGFTVISGLARGIDGIAHRTALAARGRTLAVLAGGLARIYPPEHADLAREVEMQGALLTESAMQMEPMAGMFPARNRLISGLSRGVVVIEASERSGALITASHAADQGRPVFAIPGPVDSRTSDGTHQLLRKGAILVRGADDVCEELNGSATITSPAEVKPLPEMDAVQRRIWDFLDGQPRHIDQMAQQLGLAVSQITGALLMLEMKKVIRRLPGNRYERC
jgi:DNA processing protein